MGLTTLVTKNAKTSTPWALLRTLAKQKARKKGWMNDSFLRPKPKIWLAFMQRSMLNADISMATRQECHVDWLTILTKKICPQHLAILTYQNHMTGKNSTIILWNRQEHCLILSRWGHRLSWLKSQDSPQDLTENCFIIQHNDTCNKA